MYLWLLSFVVVVVVIVIQLPAAQDTVFTVVASRPLALYRCDSRKWLPHYYKMATEDHP